MVIEGLSHDDLLNRKIVTARYDWNKDKLILGLDNGNSIVVDVRPSRGADGGQYSTLHTQTVVKD
jgi:hypothetical protein